METKFKLNNMRKNKAARLTEEAPDTLLNKINTKKAIMNNSTFSSIPDNLINNLASGKFVICTRKIPKN